MKRKKMISTVKKRFSRLNRLLEQLAVTFNPEDIHRIRIEIKKLKAFNKLTATKKKHARLPESIRRLYGSAGVARDLQLQLKNLEERNQLKTELADGYLSLLQQELEKEKTKIRLYIPSPILMAFEERVMISNLPKSVGKTRIRKFYHRERKKIMDATGGVMRYEQFHQLRKVMKTIQYNKNAIRPILAGYHPSEVNEVTELLGRYCDACASIRDYQRFSRALSDPEKLKARGLYKSFLQEKSDALKKLKQKIPSVPDLMEEKSN
jgi:CHAD domain-containing protein